MSRPPTGRPAAPSSHGALVSTSAGGSCTNHRLRVPRTAPQRPGRFCEDDTECVTVRRCSEKRLPNTGRRSTPPCEPFVPRLKGHTFRARTAGRRGRGSIRSEHSPSALPGPLWGTHPGPAATGTTRPVRTQARRHRVTGTRSVRSRRPRERPVVPRTPSREPHACGSARGY